jgi:hypothetical protein
MARILSFKYVVSGGDFSTDLDYLGTSALLLNGGQILTTSSSEDANLTLSIPTSANSLSFNSNILIGTFNTSATNLSLPSIDTNGIAVASHQGNGSILSPSIEVYGVGQKVAFGSGNLINITYKY